MIRRTVRPWDDGLAQLRCFCRPGADAGTAVSDLKLSCFYRRAGGEGPLRLQLTKLDNCFTAQFERGKVTLLVSKRQDMGGEGRDLRPALNRWSETVAVDGINSSDFTQVELLNVDYRVSIRDQWKRGPGDDRRRTQRSNTSQMSPSSGRMWSSILASIRFRSSGLRPPISPPPFSTCYFPATFFI